MPVACDSFPMALRNVPYGVSVWPVSHCKTARSGPSFGPYGVGMPAVSLYFMHIMGWHHAMKKPPGTSV